MENGLPSDNCFKTIQASDGTIWVATLHGVARFNGYRWISFTQESKQNQLPSNWIMDLYSVNNQVWFHSDRGSGYISTKTLKVKLPKNRNIGWGKLISQKNNIYISSWKGIYCYNLNRFNQFNLIQKSENKSFHHFIKYKNTFIGLADDEDGYFELKNDKLVHRHLKSNNNKNSEIEIRALLIEGESILAVTKSNGLIRINSKTNKFTSISGLEELSQFKSTCINRIQFGKELFYLIGTEGNGVLIFNSTFKKIGHWLPQSELPTTSLQSSIIQDIQIDSKNGIWISTEKGISYFHKNIQKFKAFFFYNNKIIPENTTINSIEAISKDEFIIGTETDGLFTYSISMNYAEKVNLPQSYSKNGIISICALENNQFCIASRENIGIYSLKTKRFQDLNFKKGSIFGLRNLMNKKVGIATSSGVYIYSLKNQQIEFQEKRYPNEFYSEQITKDLFIDKKGNIWALRFFNGLVKINPKTNKISRYSPKNLISNGTDFHNISYSSKNNSFYISSSAGIFVHPLSQPSNFKWINSKKGLNGDFVDRCLINPKDNLLYYTTPTGIYQYNEKKKNSFLLHTLQGYRQKWFNDFTITSDNNLLLSVSNYFVQHHLTKEIYSIPNQPIIESISNKHTQILPTEKLSLSPKENTLHISFQNTDFSNNEEIELEFTLNSSSNWTKINSGQLDLIDLSSGSYEMKLRNHNLSTGKISQISSFNFTIAQPFYFKWWFILLIILLLSGISYFIFYIRLKNKEQLMETRMQLSRDLHDELGANVSSIQIMASMLNATSEPSHPNLPFIQNITTYSKEISETINDIIWNVNPKFDTFEELSLRMKRYATTTLEAAGISCYFDVNTLNVSHQINQTTKYHIYLIFKEITNNCAKYSKANHAKITLTQEGNKHIFLFSDDGIGFDQSQVQNHGNGLKNIEKRAEKIGAEFHLSSIKNKGTTIQITLSL
jgi:ligand-binding sensor domain-containing protein